MRRLSPLGALLALLVSLGAADAPGEPPALPPMLAVGFSDQAVRQRLGAPSRASRQVLLHRMIEQWHYGQPHHLRLTFECERGQQPSLKRIDRLPQPH